MSKLMVFSSISLDGYFTDAHGDMSWAHRPDPNGTISSPGTRARAARCCSDA